MARGRTGEVLALIDRHLAGRTNVAGEELTIADITLLVAVEFMKPAKIERPAGLLHLQRWYTSVSARPSAKACAGRHELFRDRRSTWLFPG